MCCQTYTHLLLPYFEATINEKITEIAIINKYKYKNVKLRNTNMIFKIP